MVFTWRGKRSFDQRSPKPIATRPTLEALETRTLMSFGAPTTYTVGTTPLANLSRDLNADGDVDVLVFNNDSSNISVLLGNGDGTFESAVNYTTGSRPTYAGVADFNGDTKLDLAVSCGGPDTVDVLLGNGDGTFQAPTTLTAGHNPTGIVAADFNLDGKQDILVANNGSTSNNLYLFKGNGDGTFQPFQLVRGGGGPFWVITGDFNGDSKPDFATTSTSRPATFVTLGNGDGIFQRPKANIIGTNVSVVAASDINQDGDIDLVTVSPNTDFVYILHGNGDGTFQSPSTLAPPIADPFAVDVNDFDGNGFPDIAVAYYNFFNTDVSVLLNDDGTNFQTGQNYPAGLGAVTVSSGDYNNDGGPDLAVSAGLAANVCILMNQNDWPSPPPIPGVDEQPSPTAEQPSHGIARSASLQPADDVNGPNASDDVVDFILFKVHLLRTLDASSNLAVDGFDLGF